MSFEDRYLKYKNKYLDLKNNITQIGGAAVAAPAVALPPLVVGDHIQSMIGRYWGSVEAIDPPVYRLNNGRIARIANQNVAWKKLLLPANVQIYDNRPQLGPGPHPADPVERNAFLGDFVCGIDGTYWGQIYDTNGEIFIMIDDSSRDGGYPNGRIVRVDTENVIWRVLRLPEGVILQDTRPNALRIGTIAGNQLNVRFDSRFLVIGLAVHAEINTRVQRGELLRNQQNMIELIRAATTAAAMNAPGGVLASYTAARLAYVNTGGVHAPGAPVPVAPAAPAIARIAAPAQAGRPDIRTTLAAIQNIKAPTQIEAIMNRSIEDIEAERARTGLPPLTADERTQEQRRIQEIIAFQDHITCSVCKENLKNVLICRTGGHQLCATCTLDWIREQDERNGGPVQQIDCPMCREPCQLTDMKQTRQKYLKY